MLKTRLDVKKNSQVPKFYSGKIVQILVAILIFKKLIGNASYIAPEEQHYTFSIVKLGKL